MTEEQLEKRRQNIEKRVALSFSRDRVFSAAEKGDYDRFIEEFNRCMPDDISYVDYFSKFNLLMRTLYHSSGQHFDREGMHRITDYLLDNGIDIKRVESKQKKNILHWFFMSEDFVTPEESLEITRKLVEHGAEINGVDKYGITPLLFAAVPNWGFHEYTEAYPDTYAGTIRYLLEKGADPNHVDSFGRTPISFAREHHNDWVVDILEEAANANK